jgi:AcrR family transcriptional regulator
MPRRKSISDEDILDRALPVIARAGPAGFTLADIATEIGLSPATLLQRFGDKKTLVERAFGRDNERFACWIADLPEGRGVAATLAVYRAATEAFDADPDPELAEHLLWLREDIRDSTFNALARARFAPRGRCLARPRAGLLRIVRQGREPPDLIRWVVLLMGIDPRLRAGRPISWPCPLSGRATAGGRPRGRDRHVDDRAGVRHGRAQGGRQAEGPERPRRPGSPGRGRLGSAWDASRMSDAARLQLGWM